MCIAVLPGKGLSLEAGHFQDSRAFYHAVAALPGMPEALATLGFGEAQHAQLEDLRAQTKSTYVSLRAFMKIWSVRRVLWLQRQEQAAAAAGEGAAPAPAVQL